MNESVVAITKDTLYAVRLGPKKDYWRVTWTVATWAATIADVIATLGTQEFHLLLSDNLPDLGKSYEQALSELGCHLLSVENIGAMSSDQLMDKITHFTPVVEHPIPKPYQVGSLEDLTSDQKGSSHFLRYALVIVAGMLVAGGLWFLFGQDILNPPTQSPTPSASPISELPVPSPSPVVPTPKNSDYTVQIQNGSGIAGFAGKVSAKLEGLGFVVKDVGNADQSNYSHAVFKSKESTLPIVFDTIGTVASDSAWERATLPDTSPYDVVIILGQKTTLVN